MGQRVLLCRSHIDKKNTSLPLGRWTRAWINSSQKEKYQQLTKAEENVHLDSNQRHANVVTSEAIFHLPNGQSWQEGEEMVSPTHCLWEGNLARLLKYFKVSRMHWRFKSLFGTWISFYRTKQTCSQMQSNVYEQKHSS